MDDRENEGLEWQALLGASTPRLSHRSSIAPPKRIAFISLAIVTANTRTAKVAALQHGKDARRVLEILQ